MLQQLREEGGAADADDMPQCGDAVRNALVDELHSRLGLDVAGLQALSTGELVERARYVMQQGILAQ